MSVSRGLTFYAPGVGYRAVIESSGNHIRMPAQITHSRTNHFEGAGRHCVLTGRMQSGGLSHAQDHVSGGRAFYGKILADSLYLSGTVELSSGIEIAGNYSVAFSKQVLKKTRHIFGAKETDHKEIIAGGELI